MSTSDPLPGSIAEEQKQSRERTRRRGVKDRPLPGSPELELCVLSCLMQAPQFSIETLGSKLQPEHFMVESHSLLWEFVIRQINAGKPVEPRPLMEALRDAGLHEKIPYALVTEAYTASPNPVDGLYYAEIVHEKWRQREVWKHCTAVAAQLLVGIETQELEGIVGDLQANLTRVEQASLNPTKGLRTGEEVVVDALGRL